MLRESSFSWVFVALMLSGCGGAEPRSPAGAAETATPLAAAPSVAPAATQGSAPASTRVALAGTFALIDIGGRPLPAAEGSVPAAQCKQDLSFAEDIITFDGKGIYERRRIGWHGCPDDRLARRDTLQRSGQYVVSGDSITLSFGGGTEVEIELAGRMRGDSIVTFGDETTRAFRYIRRRR